MRARFAAAFTLAAIGLITLSCGGIVDPSKNTSEPFSGTLQPQQAATHPFTVSKTGEFTAKVTALAPTSTALVGLAAVFAANDGSCTNQILQSSNFVTVNAPALSGQIFSGKYCVVIYDVGTLTVAQTYTVTVSHP